LKTTSSRNDGNVCWLRMNSLSYWIGWLFNPGRGSVIRGSGGLRKVRWAAKGHGKRGGIRIIYFWWLVSDRILLLDIYAKSEKEDLAAAEIAKLKRKVIP
jgi:hypothetical protein